MEELGERAQAKKVPLLIRISHNLVSVEALLKTCYWFSRDFSCDVSEDGVGFSVVSLKPREGLSTSFEDTRDSFMSQALDFALRERVNAQTSDVRDLLLAKAFSESGVLEDQPEGTFGDSLEGAKPDGMFKILKNS